VKKLMTAGLLAIPAGERVIRLLPPLNVTGTEIDEALEKIGRSLQEG
jgi:acetylornithine/N-succinyldiaminopimelate aminotransferase